MKAYLFSIGEATTDLSEWSLKRSGFEVVLLYDPLTTLYQKYVEFLDMAKNEDMVLRCDADIIYNHRVKDLVAFTKENRDYWWMTGKSFCFLKMDLIDTAPNVMKNEAIQVGLKRIPASEEDSRPETLLSRSPEFYSPRRFMATNIFVGLHGYKQKQEDIERVLKVKEIRKQKKDWDWDLIERMQKL